MHVVFVLHWFVNLFAPVLLLHALIVVSLLRSLVSF